jgi:MFS family permease
VLADYPYPLNFALCFGAASFCMLLSFIALAGIRETETVNPAPGTSVLAYARQLPPLLRRDRDFSMFIVARILGAFGGMAVTFVALYATEQRGLPESLAGRFTAFMLGTQVITTPLLGMMADRRGYKGSMQFAFLTQMLAMVLSLMVTSTLGFSLVFSLIGASTGMLFSTALNMVVEFATPAERVTYLGLHGTLIAPSVLLAPIIGSWLAEWGGYPLAFMVAAVCGLAALVIITVFVRDPRHRQIGVAQH